MGGVSRGGGPDWRGRRSHRAALGGDLKKERTGANQHGGEAHSAHLQPEASGGSGHRHSQRGSQSMRVKQPAPRHTAQSQALGTSLPHGL